MTRKLPSQKETDAIKKRILAAAGERFPGNQGIRAFFDHGHWWIEVDNGQDSGSGPKMDGFVTYDVIDAEGAGAVDGFDFEEMG